MKSFSADYYDGKSAIPTTGTLILYQTHLEFHYEGAGIEQCRTIHWKSVATIRKKTNGCEIEIYAGPEHAGPTFQVGDIFAYSLATQYWQLNAPGWLRNHIQKLYDLPLMTKLVSISAFLAILLFFYFQGLGVAYKLLPKSVDKRIGQYVKKQILSSSQLCKNSYQEELLAKMVAILADKQQTYEVILIDSLQTNAITLPGGYIFVYSGLFTESESAEEIAGVLAHEMAHVEKRHGIRQLIRVAGFSFLMMSIIGVGSDTSELFETYSEIINSLILLKYSRSFEEEADKIAVEKMMRARISTTGMIDFFTRNSKTKKLESFLSTHPSGSQRIEKIRELSDNSKASKEIFAEENRIWDLYRSNCD